jgi:hypothetical protein
MSGAETDDGDFGPIIVGRITEIVTSPEARRIDFTLASISVDGAGLYTVATALAAGVISATVRAMENPGAQAEYQNSGNYFTFPTVSFGGTNPEKMAILHESVHAMQDVNLGRPSRGTASTYETENEAAAYVAGCLYYLYKTNDNSTNEIDFTQLFPHFDQAFKIAAKIKDKPGSVVAADDADELRRLIMCHPAYWTSTNLYAPTFSNGPYL